MTRVGLFGLGRMGTPMAGHLARTFDFASWNRSPPDPANDRAEFNRQNDATRLAARSDIAIFMLTDGDAVQSLLLDAGVGAALPQGAVVVDMGTSGPAIARDHGARLADIGIGYCDAPVSGGVSGAEAASLTILLGGDTHSKSKAAPVLSVLGTVHDLGATGAGQTAKLVNQIIVSNMIASVAEGLRFAERQGIDGEAIVKALQGGFADSVILRQHGSKMARRDFDPGGTCRLNLKDLDLAAALDGGLDGLQNSLAIRDRLQSLVVGGNGDLDHSALFLTYEDGESAA